jgi:hypothetical protein
VNFFVSKNETEFESVMSAETLMKSDAEYYAPRFAAIKALRDADDGSLHKGNEFRRVASFVNVPMFMATKISDPDFLKDKRKLYAFIDRHPEYCTYQRRGRAGRADLVRQSMPLSVLGIDYPGGPETIDGWDAVEVPLEPVGEISAGPPTPEPAEAQQ